MGLLMRVKIAPGCKREREIVQSRTFWVPAATMLNPVNPIDHIDLTIVVSHSVSEMGGGLILT